MGVDRHDGPSACKTSVGISLRTQSHFVIQFGVSLCSAGVLVYHRLPAVRNFGLGMQTSVLWTFALSFGVELSSSCYRRLVCNIGSVRTIPSEIGRRRPKYFRRMTRLRTGRQSVSR